MLPRPLVCIAFFLFLGVQAKAIILFGGGNTFNVMDPGTGVPWDAVARVTDSSGTSARGSAVHLGGGYMLTANHVNLHTHVTFDGLTFYKRDTNYAPVQVAPNVDMKVFRLDSVPSVGAADVYEGTGELVAPATMIGWGVGRDPTENIGNTSVDWGSTSTIDKRWAENVPRSFYPINYQSGSYTAIATVLGRDSGTPSGLGANEGAATIYDSGSGLFQFLNGGWHLIGLTTTVTTSGSSNFGDDVFSITSPPDENYFARVSEYSDEILGIVPEPGQFGLVLAVIGFFFANLRRSGEA